MRRVGEGASAQLMGLMAADLPRIPPATIWLSFV